MKDKKRGEGQASSSSSGSEEKLLQDELDRKIMNFCQGGFPLVPRPFQHWAMKLDIDEEELISRIRSLKKRGALSRFGPVINPRAFGGDSTLVAMSVPESRFDEVAKTLGEKPQVSHNYRRNHKLNMWFVVSAKSDQELEHTLEQIQDEVGLKVYNMPMLEEYSIGVKFSF